MTQLEPSRMQTNSTWRENWPRISRALEQIENADTREIPKDLRKKIIDARCSLNEPHKAARLILLAGIVLAVIGYVIVNWSEWGVLSFLNDFYANIAAEAISIGVTVLIIERLNKRRAEEVEKKALILQMGSPDNAFAIEAVRQLRDKGWTHDGTLQGAHLLRANLSNADLFCADLSNTNLFGANLSNADLFYADLSNASLRNANLKDAYLIETNLSNAKYNYRTTWPDGFDYISSGAILTEIRTPRKRYDVPG